MVKEGEVELELVYYLGQLMDELEGDSIQEFVAVCPKIYVNQTRNLKKKVILHRKSITGTEGCCERVIFLLDGGGGAEGGGDCGS